MKCMKRKERTKKKKKRIVIQSRHKPESKLPSVCIDGMQKLLLSLLSGYMTHPLHWQHPQQDYFWGSFRENPELICIIHSQNSPYGNKRQTIRQICAIYTLDGSFLPTSLSQELWSQCSWLCSDPLPKHHAFPPPLSKTAGFISPSLYKLTIPTP